MNFIDLKRFSPRDEARTGRKSIFRVTPKRKATILELEDVLFHLNSAVMLPAGSDDPSEVDGTGPTSDQPEVSGTRILAAVLRYVARYPSKRLLLAGHTDTTGNPQYNVTLSGKRANSMVSLLQGDRARWVDVVDDQSEVEDYQAILSYLNSVWKWDCDPGPVDDIHGSKTAQGVHNFQECYNNRFDEAITVDGIVGPQTWGAVFDVYERDVARLVGCSVPELGQWRACLRFADTDHRILACGESMPLDEVGRDGYRSQENRRVEFMFFDQEKLSDDGLFEVEPRPENRFVVYNEDLFEREHIDPSVTFEDAEISLEVEYIPGATLNTPLTLKDESDNEISAPEQVLEKDWQVVFTDDHMLPADETDLLGGHGENQSVPAFYRSEGWDATSTPVLPLKITVKNEGAPILGGGALRLCAQLLVESTETDALTPDSEKSFIKDTFDTLAYTDPDNAELNANNAPDTVGGIRPAGSFQTAEGRFATFDGEDQDTAVPLTDYRDQKRQALCTVPAPGEQGPQNESVINLLVYLPQQTGERYRLRFHILGQQSESEVTSEVLTIWRRLRIELVVNIGTALSDDTLTDVQDAYEQFHIELGDPEHTTTLTEDEWRDVTYKYFNDISFPDADDASAYKYDKYLLPDIDMPDKRRDASDHAKKLAHLYRDKGLRKEGIDDPTGNLIVYGPPIHPSSSTLGFYLGNALSAFFRGKKVRSTFVHEIGHGRFLRHSFTRPVSGKPKYDGDYIFPTSNNRFWRDHHQGFGGGCTMSYTRDRTKFKFCAVCQLNLRFWDKVELRSIVEEALNEGWGDIVIVDGSYNDITSPLELSAGDSEQLRVLAGPDETGSVSYYKDVTRHGVITWEVQPSDVLSVKSSGEVQALNSGSGILRASIGSASSARLGVRVT
jgi:hypothetical protein